MENWLVILLHQALFQGMFVMKNILLARKLGKPVRGGNREANLAIVFFALFIVLAFAFSLYPDGFGTSKIVDQQVAVAGGCILIALNLALSVLSLVGLRDSWRVGVLEGQKTDLVTDGVYRFSRNPYFASYLLMFAAYTVLLQNLLLLGFAILGFLFIHKMVLKEESYLSATHGDAYLHYRQKTPRYFLI